ncbi:acetyl/propionyl/methylcrotonyl-CoA carboxylase subunit alpha [Leucobacter aridicollis]|uniref:acetyl/propionyl/methylcrotonyl-CoA carboxylase subunit alpha n=1 Tax=Leucobacter aridicollis TaxID=283878 RepID=UPI0021052C6E|nr:biotin carboxylase N-terminal domain-containing protein [Leucobacter aridicollis]UTX52864.1 ATP-grasp domain-containing protein [Leucobacter aridicollis]
MTLTKILIANRGEIAVRIIRAANDAGIASVAVYSDDDADALHVRLADEAYALNGATPGESYLSIEKLLAVAARAGVDAVHPGYGFLSERADFATAVLDAGLTWIGPDPQTIETLGDKARARALAAEVGAPLVPGTPGAVSGVDDVFAFADEHGLPLAIKAVFGGGGRGMRVVRERADIADAYDAAVREATAAFGKGDCLVERFLDRPRHIEAQVLGDRHGRIEVLGTRDCSLQRRNQKLVEEAPAPFISDELRARIHDAAAAVCAAANYVGAGTVEFLLGDDGTLSFLEVNTRLQVEHPITEAVTGVDLVQQQFIIAAGNPMTVPATVPAFGHAFEFRINAEDPGLGYLPTPGTIARLELPAGPGVRVDSGVYQGYSVPGSFDSMLAKLVVWGADREEALRRSRRALAEFVVDGVATVLPFHRSVVADDAFTAPGGAFGVHTRWIEEESTAVFEPAAAVPAPGVPRLTRLPIELDGKIVELGLPESLLARLETGAVTQGAGEAGEGAGEASAGALTAPFASTLASWSVADGAVVQAGDTVALLEAMKMEVPVKAPISGTLRYGAVSGVALAAGASIGSID